VRPPHRGWFAPDEAPDPALADALVGALSSEQDEPYGFEATVSPNRSVFLLRFPSPSELELEIPATPHFSIVAPDTVTFAAPRLALLSRSLPEPAVWVIRPSVGLPSLHTSAGEPLDFVREHNIQTNDTYIYIHMESDAFVPSVGRDSLASVELIDAFLSGQGEPSGWNAIVRRQLTYSAVARQAVT